MTVLIGYKNKNSITITGDLKSTHINIRNGQRLDSYNQVVKVLPIGENMIIGIGEHHELGMGIREMLNSIFKLIHNLSVEEMIEHVRKTALYAYNMFKEVHPKRKTDLFLIIAALDKEQEKTYLYTLSSREQFEPREIGQENIIIEGCQRQKVKSYLSDALNTLSGNELISNFSAAIRGIDDIMVSKETYSFRIEIEEGILTWDVRLVDSYGNMYDQNQSRII